MHMRTIWYPLFYFNFFKTIIDLDDRLKCRLRNFKPNQPTLFSNEKFLHNLLFTAMDCDEKHSDTRIDVLPVSVYVSISII